MFTYLLLLIIKRRWWTLHPTDGRLESEENLPSTEEARVEDLGLKAPRNRD